MSKLIIPGRFIYATGIIALAVLCMVSKDFIVGRPPAWPAGFNINPALAYISGVVLIIAAIAIILKRKARLAAFLISALIFFFSVLRHLPNFMNDWANAYKSLALVGGFLPTFRFMCSGLISVEFVCLQVALACLFLKREGRLRCFQVLWFWAGFSYCIYHD
jgi:uncharacterized membrane protein YphA (DoxX/SURF4 family)